jgi:hypothetical protein
MTLKRHVLEDEREIVAADVEVSRGGMGSFGGQTN